MTVANRYNECSLGSRVNARQRVSNDDTSGPGPTIGLDESKRCQCAPASRAGERTDDRVPVRPAGFLPMHGFRGLV